jgi:hypothetical protein
MIDIPVYILGNEFHFHLHDTLFIMCSGIAGWITHLIYSLLKGD